MYAAWYRNIHSSLVSYNIKSTEETGKDNKKQY